MAVQKFNSDIIKAYTNKQRVRTQNYRGSVVNTTVISTDTWGSSDVGSTLYLTLIPYAASILEIKISFPSATTQLAFTVGIAGIEPDRKTFTDIKTDLMTWPAAATDANRVYYLSISQYWGQTIYQQLCNAAAPYKPISAFEPYKNDEHGVLFFRSTAANTAAVNGTRVSILWINPSPSETPKIHKTINVLNAQEAA